MLRALVRNEIAYEDSGRDQCARSGISGLEFCVSYDDSIRGCRDWCWSSWPSLRARASYERL
jgi:hypothetical protein